MDQWLKDNRGEAKWEIWRCAVSMLFQESFSQMGWTFYFLSYHLGSNFFLQIFASHVKDLAKGFNIGIT